MSAREIAFISWLTRPRLAKAGVFYLSEYYPSCVRLLRELSTMPVRAPHISP